VLNYKINYIEWENGFDGIIYENNKISIHCIPLDHRVPCSGYLFREKPKGRRLNTKELTTKLTPSEISLLKSGEDVINENGEVKFLNQEVTLPPARSLSYAYCSDTRFNKAIIPIIKEADLLYHESTFQSDMEERADSTYHSTANQAAQIAKEGMVKRLIIGHFSTRYKYLDEMLNEAKSVFENTELAIEGNSYEVD
jgi:ribonuclease Z